MALSEDGSLLITGSEDCTARMWSTKTDDTECLGALEGHTSYITCVASCDTFVVTGSADSTIKKWDMTSCDCLFTYEGHESRISRIICTGEFIFSSSYDKTARAWLFDTSDLGDGNESKACIRVFKGHRGGVYPIIFVAAQDQGSDSEVDDADADMVTIHPGDLLLTGSVDKTAKSWSFDSETGSSLRTFRGHTAPVSCMATDRDGTVLFTAGPDRTIKIWEISSAICKQTMEGHNQSIVCMQVVNKLLYSGSADTTARCWVTEFGDCTRTYKSHKHSVICLKVADGVVFTGCGDTLARAFDAKSGALKRSYMGHEAAINCLQYIEGKLYTGSNDGVLKVWDAKNIADDPPPEDTQNEDEDEQPEERGYYREQDKRLKDLERRLDGANQDNINHDDDIKAYERELAALDDD
ncbi:WD repeat-containing protein 86-like [Pollicipes pollicipes]|nr:WD repeat-containing protein 86-like [Pollicipes pollicipes]